MNRRHFSRLRCWSAVIAVAACAPTARAADRFWRSQLGGAFSDPANWSAGSVPGLNDIAHFGFSTATQFEYNVTFSASVGTLALRIEDDSVVFLLNGFSYNSHSDSEHHIGDIAGRSGKLFVTGGKVDVTTVPTLIGAVATASGTLTISTGGRFESSSGILRVGHLGSGTLNVELGGVVQSLADVFLAQNSGTSGTANVSGANSMLNTAVFTVGNQGSGTLNVTTGGQVQNTTAYVGNLTGSTGVVTNNAGNHTVSGTLSLAASAGATGTYQLTDGSLSAPIQSIGSQGNGTFTQVGGSNTAATQLDVGVGNGAVGDYSLDGGSVIVGGPLGVGFSGTGTFTQTGGYISVQTNLRIAPFTTANGHFSLDGDGIVEAGLSNVGGNGILAGGTGRLDILSGAMFITGRLKIWNTTNTVVNLSGGILSVGELDTNNNPARFNWTAGELHVTTSTGNLTNTAGVLAPGPLFAAGTTTINGTYTQQAGGELDIEIGGTSPGSQFDRVDVTGNVTLAGTLSISLIGGFTPQIGNTFVILTHPARTGIFSSVTGISAGPGKMFQVQYNPGNVTLTVVPAVPGDLNGDGQLTAADAGPFALALANPTAFQQQFPTGNIFNGDLNHDLAINGLDIGLFVACLIHGGCP